LPAAGPYGWLSGWVRTGANETRTETETELHLNRSLMLPERGPDVKPPASSSDSASTSPPPRSPLPSIDKSCPSRGSSRQVGESPRRPGTSRDTVRDLFTDAVPIPHICRSVRYAVNGTNDRGHHVLGNILAASCDRPSACAGEPRAPDLIGHSYGRTAARRGGRVSRFGCISLTVMEAETLEPRETRDGSQSAGTVLGDGS
jgi:hypothetical protein